MKNNKKEVVINGRQAVKGLMIIGLVICVICTAVGIVTGDSQLIHDGSTLAIFETMYFCLNCTYECKEKKAKKNEVIL